MLIDSKTLPEDIESLKQTIAEMTAAQAELEQKYRLQIDYLQERIRLLQNELFGRKTEKRPPSEDSKQLKLFNEAEVLCPEAADKDEKAAKTLEIPAHTRKKPKRKPLPKDLPRVEVIHDLAEQEKFCACGTPLCRIGQEDSEKLDIVPAKIQVIHHIRYKYACKNCEGVQDDGPTVKVAPMPPQIIDKGMATPGLLAYIATAKYADCLPLYRQEKIFARHGIELSRATMAGWMVKSAQACEPVMELFHNVLLSGPVVNVDETVVQVMKEPGRSNSSKSYMWVYCGGPVEKPVVLFQYSPTRAGDNAREMLNGYAGYVQSDGFAGYNILEANGSPIRLVGCMAHMRRHFIKVIDARGKAGPAKSGSAEVALSYISRLYEVEKYAGRNELSPEAIYDLRRERARPILEEFKAWMDKRVDQTPPKSLLGKAFTYALTHWPRVIRYLEDGRLKPDNNVAENAIRPFVVGRKNWLFAGHPNGAKASATLYSLIETAKACGLEPYRYLRFLFEKLPYASTSADYQALLPQTVDPAQLV
jgi:transposase